MSRRFVVQSRAAARVVAALVAVAVFIPASHSLAGNNGNFFRGAVGGVSIDPEGVLREPHVQNRAKAADLMRADVAMAPDELNPLVGMRMVSLRGLEEAIREEMKVRDDLLELSDDIRFLGGLQRVQYVFLYPETNDIVLAGPGEGWRVDDKANVVGITTGRPVLQLDDLLVALRSVNAARQGQGISCSIDPSPEGRQQFQNYINGVRTINQFNRVAAEKAMGAQRITLTGVPATSHFARVMVAADFRMKRYAMNLDEAPIRGLPSFLALMKQKRGQLDNAMPRWWLACNYDGVVRSDDGLAWEIRGPGVKVMTEDDFVAADGSVTGAGRANPIAQQWANTMTEKYDELSKADPCFGELRNIMDLSVVAALIAKHDMLDKVGCQLPSMMGERDSLAVEKWSAPKTVDTQCSLMQVGRNYIITASGGVQIESWAVVNKADTDDQVAGLRTKATSVERKSWRWQ